MATVISTSSFTNEVDTSAATTEPLDPTPSCGNNSRDKSVWYRFTAPNPGTVTADTLDSDYDTILSTYTGSCAALSPLLPDGCNDDDPRDGAQSGVSFVTRAGTTYYFMVSAYDGDGGNLKFHLRLGALPVCSGDCDGNGMVTTAECDTCERIVGGEPLSLCPGCDANRNGQVTINELTLCRQSVTGCVTPSPTSTRRPTATPTWRPSAAPTRSPTRSQTTTPPPTPTRAVSASPSPQPSRTVPPSTCYGDCNGDGTVRANELVTVVGIISRRPGATSCGQADDAVATDLPRVIRNMFDCEAGP